MQLLKKIEMNEKKPKNIRHFSVIDVHFFFLKSNYLVIKVQKSVIKLFIYFLYKLKKQ